MPNGEWLCSECVADEPAGKPGGKPVAPDDGTHHPYRAASVLATSPTATPRVETRVAEVEDILARARLDVNRAALVAIQRYFDALSQDERRLRESTIEEAREWPRSHQTTLPRPAPTAWPPAITRPFFYHTPASPTDRRHPH